MTLYRTFGTPEGRPLLVWATHDGTPTPLASGKLLYGSGGRLYKNRCESGNIAKVGEMITVPIGTELGVRCHSGGVQQRKIKGKVVWFPPGTRYRMISCGSVTSPAITEVWD